MTLYTDSLSMTLFLVYLLYVTALSIGLERRGIRSATSSSMLPAPAGRPTRVLIVGATGGTGRQLVAQALERGHVVTALARDPSALRIEHPQLHVISGDVLDYPSVEAAVGGQDAVEGTRNVLHAMEIHRVQRLVCVTTLGLGNSAGRMGMYYTFFVIPFVLPFYFWDKTRQEQLIAASRVNWT